VTESSTVEPRVRRTDDTLFVEHPDTGDALIMGTSVVVGTIIVGVGTSTIRLSKDEAVRYAEDMLRLARRCG
jgi:hypothetical protein